MKCLLFALLPTAALTLTYVNKQTMIAGGYRSTQQQDDPTCEANKWCMKIRVDSGEGESKTIAINSKYAESSYEEETCDTRAANKCCEQETKITICCCDSNKCNDHDYAPGIEPWNGEVKGDP